MSATTTSGYIVLWQGEYGAILGNADGDVTIISPVVFEDVDFLKLQSPDLHIVPVESDRVEAAYRIDDSRLMGKEAVDLKDFVALFENAHKAVVIRCGYLPHNRLWCIKGQPIIRPFNSREH